MGAPADDPVGGFASAARLIGGALLLVSRAGEIRWANEKLMRLASRTPGDVLAARLHDIVVDDAGAVEELLRSASRSQDFVPHGITLRAGTGASVPCRCDAALYRSASQEQPALIALRLAPRAHASAEFVALRERIRHLSAEISARKLAEDAARQWGARYRVTLESIGDAVIATDGTGCITFMNDVAQRLTGWQVQKAAGHHLDEVFVICNEQTREPVESPVAKVLRVGEVVGLANHTVLLRRDGSEVPIDDSGAPIKGNDGEIEGVVLVFRDLSERHALERELLAKTRSLEEADRRKDEFLSMLAHELRNPLAPIRSGVEIFRRRANSDAALARIGQMMDRQLHHLVRLVDDLLDVTRLTQGKFELRVADVHLRRVLDDAHVMAQPLFDTAGVALERDADVPDVVLRGDAVRLVQLLVNLLSNAAKFSPRGQRVHIATRLAPATVEIVVSDKGIGIHPEHLGDVFDLFFQADQRMGREHGGLGIGLTIAYSIATLHGGSLRAHSAGPGLGSTFTVELPR